MSTKQGDKAEPPTPDEFQDYIKITSYTALLLVFNQTEETKHKI